MFNTINQILSNINDIVWGVPLITMILATGIFLTVRLKGLQLLQLPRALKYMFSSEEDGSGEVSSFAALCTALSATIGTGNIVGVATAIVAGGPGALFWMWIAAFFGMATKYAEGLLSIKYRVVDPSGHVLGGPFYYIQNGMGNKWKWLAKLFAFFGVGVGLLGIGTFAQVNGISNAVNNVFDPNNTWTATIFGRQYSYTVLIASVVLTLCVALVLIGGIKRIANVSQVVVPFMAGIYICSCITLLVTNHTKIPAAFEAIFASAFGLRAASGGALGAIIMAMQKGIARGIFSNEAGLGSAPIAAAAAKTNEPVRQGLVSMTGTFIDTILICTMTGLCILCTGAWNMGLEGVAVTTKAFQSGLPFNETASAFLLMLCLVFFAFTTILGWNYYSERCLEYLCGNKPKLIRSFRYVYILAVFIGPFMTVSTVWTIADIFNALMALPNLIAIVSLSGVIASETKAFLTKEASTSRRSTSETEAYVVE